MFISYWCLLCLKKKFGPKIGPPSGPMKPAPSVCQSVSQSVSDKSSHTSHHQFFLIFCIKLAFSKSRKVTFSDFRKKNVLAQKWAIWAQNGPNLGFLAIFSTSNHQIFAILQIMIDNYDVYQLLVFLVLEKKNLGLKLGHLGPNWAQKWGFG